MDAPTTPVIEVVASGSVEVDAGPDEIRADGGEAPRGELRPARGRIFLSMGEQDGADEAKVREAARTLAPGLELLALEVRRSHTFVEVRPEAVDDGVAALNGKDWNGKALFAERARRRRR